MSTVEEVDAGLAGGPERDGPFGERVMAFLLEGVNMIHPLVVLGRIYPRNSGDESLPRYVFIAGVRQKGGIQRVEMRSLVLNVSSKSLFFRSAPQISIST